MSDQENDKTKSARAIAMRSGAVVAGGVFALFFFSDDRTLAGFSPLLRLGLAIFFWVVSCVLGWLYFRNRKLV